MRRTWILYPTKDVMLKLKLLLAGLILTLSGLASAQYNNTSFYHPAEDGGCGVADVTIDWAPYVYLAPAAADRAGLK